MILSIKTNPTAKESSDMKKKLKELQAKIETSSGKKFDEAPTSKEVKPDPNRKLYKVLNSDGTASHGGDYQYSLPKPHKKKEEDQWGKWTPEITDLSLCNSGYHVTKEKHLHRWLFSGAHVYEVHCRGATIDGTDKEVWGQMRLTKLVGIVSDEWTSFHNIFQAQRYKNGNVMEAITDWDAYKKSCIDDMNVAVVKAAAQEKKASEEDRAHRAKRKAMEQEATKHMAPFVESFRKWVAKENAKRALKKERQLYAHDQTAQLIWLVDKANITKNKKVMKHYNKDIHTVLSAFMWAEQRLRKQP